MGEEEGQEAVSLSQIKLVPDEEKKNPFFGTIGFEEGESEISIKYGASDEGSVRRDS